VWNACAASGASRSQVPPALIAVVAAVTAVLTTATPMVRSLASERVRSRGAGASASP
jgi:hypothetical protein